MQHMVSRRPLEWQFFSKLSPMFYQKPLDADSFENLSVRTLIGRYNERAVLYFTANHTAGGAAPLAKMVWDRPSPVDRASLLHTATT